MKQWSYRTWGTLLSALSWMRWHRRRRQWRELRQLQERLEQELRLRQELRMALLEALTPLAEALQRLDNLQKVAAHQQHQHLKYQEELLKEILNSLQPSAHQQIFPLIGPQNQPPSFHDLAS